MKTNTAQEALEILKLMIDGGVEEYMFEYSPKGDFLDVISHESTDGWIKYKVRSGSIYPEIHTINAMFSNIFHAYIPTMPQLWKQILKFNEMQEEYNVDHILDWKRISIYKHKDNRVTKRFKYTDTDSMYLALLKVCVEIWKIKQED
jgi:hypothetical protein